jgi:2-oxo-3-(phosphooxy)propyl 3-oxoalkanoate synthase
MTMQLALLHRRNPDEAFLTGAAPAGPAAFTATAQLPPAHPHYAAHTGPSRGLDPMLLLECARQAETYAAHTLFGVEPDAHFVLRNWSAEFPAGPHAAAGELELTAVTRNPRSLRGRISGLEYDFALRAAGVTVGRVRMDVGYLSHAAYTTLRTRRHQGPPPSSDGLAPTPGARVAPARVGRVRATDVLLLDVVTAGSSVTAGLRVAVENPSLFDHAQDHVPAMVLMEAARQLAALALGEWGGPAPDRTRMTALSASFAAYAELDAPVELVAEPFGDAGVSVTFRQAGTGLAQARIGLAIPGQGREAA